MEKDKPDSDDSHISQRKGVLLQLRGNEEEQPTGSSTCQAAESHLIFDSTNVLEIASEPDCAHGGIVVATLKRDFFFFINL